MKLDGMEGVVKGIVERDVEERGCIEEGGSGLGEFRKLW